MVAEDTLEKYGLFNAKVPRYTSYPPANLFIPDAGRRFQLPWLNDVKDNEALSLYVHIPFCRRLCWFCACRTQGTRTFRPVETYVNAVLLEIAAIRRHLPPQVSVSRLHLGGGTPTLLAPATMDKLLNCIYENFERAADHEFSVEIDPTEALPELLATLADWGMNRASIGVQDFAPKVQDAVGRRQSYAETLSVVTLLRDLGVRSLNLDVIYGLPHQTQDTLAETLDQVICIHPDRLALYGYAHVPKISKRQVMIDEDALPGPLTRHRMAEMAHGAMVDHGYVPLGIDHFALPDDSLAKAAAAGTLRRNFQGYTDDPCETLIGFGTSAISQFRAGFLQNAVATAAYSERVFDTGLAAHKGVALTSDDRVLGNMIHELMCYGSIRLSTQGGTIGTRAHDILTALQHKFADVVSFDGDLFTIYPEAKSITRLIAASLDGYDRTKMRHSAAI